MDKNKFSNFIYLFIIYLIESFVYWNIFLFSFLLKIFFYRDKYLTSLSVGLFLRFAIFEMIIEFFEGKFLLSRIKRKHDSEREREREGQFN